ncbi:GxxExxY protein [Neolewinella agarilytica]|uniref:GxxExxY protein n=1 Tax=Neolewinella agarilytica TaxID=478744 RepID=A0A1H9DT83_9BACT|nr:GxxExxY protein [Neolewinella agarilytica]SEQ16672.1 GxxExxY protein [Neolewinella agarilytica]
MKSYNTISYDIRGAAFRVHSKLGPGLLESAYEACLVYELRKIGYKVESQKSLPLSYGEVYLDAGYRIDLLIDDLVIIELKSVKELQDIHTAQLLTYMRLSKVSLGLLMNFNVRNMQHGIKRYVL